MHARAGRTLKNLPLRECTMAIGHARERPLLQLLARIDTAAAVSRDLVDEILLLASPRYQAAKAIRCGERVIALTKAGAWVELALALIELELPDWGIHRLSRDDSRWVCSVSVQGLAMNWSDDIVEFQHEELALAIYGALVQAQIRKLRGTAQSNVTTFPGSRLAAAYQHRR